MKKMNRRTFLALYRRSRCGALAGTGCLRRRTLCTRSAHER